MALLHVGKCVEVLYLKGDVELLTELLAEMLITIRFFTTQMEVAVQRSDWMAKGVQNVQESHTVRASTESHKERLRGGGDAKLIGHELADERENISRWMRH